MATQYKQLGQLKPADTAAASVYSPSTDATAKLLLLVICNTTGSAATYQVFHDADGSTYDATTALSYSVSLAANTSTYLDLKGIFMNNSSGNIGVQSGTGAAINFTLYGVEYSKYDKVVES